MAYLGDAVYSYYDGWHVRLRTNDHRDGKYHDQIFLDPDVIEGLNAFYKRVIAKKEKEQQSDA